MSGDDKITLDLTEEEEKVLRLALSCFVDRRQDDCAVLALATRAGNIDGARTVINNYKREMEAAARLHSELIRQDIERQDRKK